MASLSTLSNLLGEFISSLLTWKALALLLALINLKNLPLVWHARLLHHLYRNLRRSPRDPHHPPSTHPLPHPTHPIFLPLTITSRTPILETDYNFHKSNSTYFSDLDIARTALATRIFTPGSRIVNRDLDAELASSVTSPSTSGAKDSPQNGSKLRLYIAVGSVFCSFKREIKPFERYEITSRLIAWDEKWVYIVSYFVRPGKGGNGKKAKGKMLASALGKYVVKKGRVTVPPERVLRASGFLPERPDGAEFELVGESVTPGESGSEEGITATATATASGVDTEVVKEVILNGGDGDGDGDAEKEEQRRRNVRLSWNEEDWPWERIEEERLRGLRVVEGYAGLDAKLFEEWGGE
ncbi:acyl-CoA thioesterase [Aspergillus saccharolyticus JOP 1030-1]|uniref:Capsule polysaccharide biosynthesis protein n=1 Tax=Aspergillus saccharolyticus JOP 1030-1 TaxID=1450539 RepID=A0A318ZFL0_9EURO|nr:hypothetical protein BP01DRAFT_365083 [Aspergillus saccharolyticus JOP 1030-1]PYH46336.1 hypothetical protein BP01DRAFT_365083 [Aspergillus saccharolyticus JOP 1030-1]